MTHSTEKDVPPMCSVVERASLARCLKGVGHDGPHQAWAHYPGQLVTWEWDTRVTAPAEGGT